MKDSTNMLDTVLVKTYLSLSRVILTIDSTPFDSSLTATKPSDSIADGNLDISTQQKFFANQNSNLILYLLCKSIDKSLYDENNGG